jgi:hypothetical protein
LSRLALIALVAVAPHLSGCVEGCALGSDRSEPCSDDHDQPTVTITVIDDTTCKAVDAPSFTQGNLALPVLSRPDNAWRIGLSPSMGGVRTVLVRVSASGYRDAVVEAHLLVDAMCCLLPGNDQVTVRLVPLAGPPPDGGVSDAICR